MKRNKNQRPIPDKDEFEIDYVNHLMEVWKDHFKTDKECSEIVGVSQSWFTRVRTGKARPGMKLLRALGLARKYKYYRI